MTPFAAFRSATNFRDADDFIPERWISSEYDSDNKSALQPFSVGPRNCLGKKYVSALVLDVCLLRSLAYHEMRLILAMVLYSFDLSLCGESKNWNDQKVFTLWEKPPLMVALAGH